MGEFISRSGGTGIHAGFKTQCLYGLWAQIPPSAPVNNWKSNAHVLESVDIGDLKSLASNGVPVRVRMWAPRTNGEIA